jgi:DNA-directed RNA polymerase II subunit RPB1
MAPPPATLNADVEEVGEVKFAMLTAEDIRAQSACEVTSSEFFNGVSPVPGGLYDPRMGAYEYGSRCHTCMHDNSTCPGHYGHIELATPVFNIETRGWVQKLLKCVCTRCASLMARSDDPDMAKLARRKTISNHKRFTAVVAACTKTGVKACPACGARRADTVTWDKKTASAFELGWKAEGESPAQVVSMDANMVESLFRRITAADAATTGIHRPDALLMSVLPVPPIAVRPPAKNSSGQRRDDDLTIQLSLIVKNNNSLKQRILAGASADILTGLTQLLQNECITYINNTTTGGVQIAKVKATNRPLRSVTSRLKGKDGRIRGNLSGKRVDQSARSVITPDPNISVEELGMPLRVAKTLSMPEVVRGDNMERLQSAVENGPGEYPGAVYVRVSSTGSLVQLKRVEARRRIKLEIGDVVHRHLLDGDVVLFNRQPSLHRMSMMAHRVRVMPYDTFRLSVMVTPPYNADFDGDEMNAHCPQSVTTATELRMLSGVASQIITPREHAPIIGVVQDVALGLHLITADDVRVNRKAACNMTAHLSTCAGEVGPEVWSGRDLLSSLLPPTLHLKSDKETIEFGRVTAGQLNKDSYQRSTNGILHAVYNDNGPRRAVRLLDDTQNLACDWLMTNGFSVGIGDLICKPQLLEDIGAAMAKVRSSVDAIVMSIHTGDFVNDSHQSNAEVIELRAIVELENMFKVVATGSIDDSRSRDSRLLSMVDVGAKSKGKTMNVCQMVGSVGQQTIDQRRVPLSFEGRVLPHFHKYDDGCDARGMVESSFVKGLTPREFFMHAMAGREGLIDTAVKTSETGYLQRKLIKALEDCKVAYDRSVRGANGAIVQFMYGEDGMDACSIETHKMPTTEGDLSSMLERFFWTAGDCAGMQALLSGDVLEALADKEAAPVFERLEAHFRALVADKDALAHVAADEVYQPIAFDRILRSAARTHGATLSDMHPTAALDVIDDLIGKMGVGPHLTASPMLSALIRAFLSPKALVREYRMTAAGLDAAKGAIERAFLSALCSPSEMVGILAAQSIAEPLTQMVLNTFHSTGVGSATKQLGGVPRIKELLGNTKHPKTPFMTVYLTRPAREVAFAMCDRVRSTTVADIMTSTAIMYDAGDDPDFGQDAEAKRLAALYKAFDIDAGDAALSPWLLKLDLDRRKMIDLDVHMHDVHRAITEAFTVHSVHSDDGSRDLVMRLRPPATSPDMMSELVAFEDHVLAARVSGIPDIRSAFDFKDDGKRYDHVRREWVSREDEHFVTTQGANFIEILSMDGVDSVRTTTNVIHQVLEVLGIEAARAALLSELTGAYKPGSGSYVNHRHLSLLVDFMTHSGDIAAVDRHGINTGDIGPLAKCSFEQPVDNLVKAAVFRESDKVEGVAASIILGQVSRCGTGDGDVVLDPDAYTEIEGEKAPAADLRNERDPANEPALDSLMGFTFAVSAARDIIDIDPAALVAAVTA